MIAPSAMAAITVNVVPSGPGSGSVSGRFAGGTAALACSWNGRFASGACQTTTDQNTTLTISALPTFGGGFSGWGPGACSGAPFTSNGGTCTIPIHGSAIATLTVAPIFGSSATIAVVKTGSGQGTVISTPAGVNCGSDCSGSFSGKVTLTAYPTAASAFGGWTGACSPFGKNPVCVLNAVQNAAVGAVFNVNTIPFQVTASGSGSGTVTSSPMGISCPSTCNAQVVSGTTVTLVPNPGTGSVFAGWTGSCTGTGTCRITVTSAVAVNAVFQKAAVQASMTGWHTTTTKRARVTRVTIRAGQQVDVSIRIVKKGRTVASRFLNNFGPGTRNVRVRIPNRVSAGRAQLVVKMTNELGTSKTQKGRVNLKKPR